MCVSRELIAILRMTMVGFDVMHSYIFVLLLLQPNDPETFSLSVCL
jgi:hypothetical protein